MYKSDDLVVIGNEDNVGIAMRELRKGEEIHIGGKKIVVNDHIQAPHKIALTHIRAGDQIIKYGASIGTAVSDIAAGELVHLHNIHSNLEKETRYAYAPEKAPHVEPLLMDTLTFKGYKRPSGEVGIRNYVYVLPTVFCANGFAEKLARIANEIHPQSENFDGFISLSHFSGCCEEGANLEHTRQILASLAKNANAGAVLFVGVGCEINNLDNFIPALGELGDHHVEFVNLQDAGDEMQKSLMLVEKLYGACIRHHREECPIADLIVAMNCGGSDGFSGITANPLLGEITDIITAQGASVILTEVPEMFGVEQTLMNRAVSREVYSDLVDMIKEYKKDYQKYGVPVYSFPTDANNKGGISTLEEKSLGCIEKGGRAKVAGVLPYGGRMRSRGLNLLAGPAHDFVSITGQIAAGANLVIFTTGRGTPAGFAAPTIKVTTNSDIFNRKPHWFEYDAGDLLTDKGMEQAVRELLNIIVEVANGEVKTKAEANNYFAMGILHDGITL